MSVTVLSAGGTSLVLDMGGEGLPRVLHWGAGIAPGDAEELAALALTARAPLVNTNVDRPVPVGVVAEPSSGWVGTPGIEGSRAGRAFAPLFTTVCADVTETTGHGGTVRVTARDDAAGLAMGLTICLSPHGIVRLRVSVTNTGDDDYALGALTVNLPVPATASELLDFTGRWLRERTPQRHPFRLGSYVRGGRRGRTGADATLLLIAGSAGFGFRHGEVWGLHTAWSGNQVSYAERDAAGVGLLAAGELLLPGEVLLAPGQRYSSPIVLGSYGWGLDELSGRFHAYLRARPSHPSTPRPVTLNTWEAVYFDHDLTRLTELADLAARVGVERFVLDDGWFRGRRCDSAGLGDWYTDDDVWPDGLTPLVDHVRGLGMRFGLWVEPEMINVDSDLARAHPEWIMSPGDRLPPEARHQQVLDLSQPDAYAHILGRLDALVTEYALDYLKWDHNRDLVAAGHSPAGTPGVHDQTVAVYRLIDELRERHPGLEIESCSSGGARADLGILERTDRIWASDCLDALERQHNQRWTGLLLPPEMIGSHVGATTAHSTGRTHTLDFRAGTALFGHFGIEWDITGATPAELDGLAAWIETYKRFRALLHGGTVVRADHPDPAHWVHGVVAPDRGEALYAFVALRTGDWAPPGRIRLPGLDPAKLYRISLVTPVCHKAYPGVQVDPVWADREPVLRGDVLSAVGIQAPALRPEQLRLIHVAVPGR